MPPDDTNGLDDADLPGLDDNASSTEADGWDDADLPGLDDESPSPEAEAPTRQAETASDTTKAMDESDWTEAELDDWFKNDFGGDAKFEAEFGWDAGMPLTGEAFHDGGDDLRSSAEAYRDMKDQDQWEDLVGGDDPWERLSQETKARFRRGWESYQADITAAPDSIVGDLAPYGPDYSQPPKPSMPRWIFVGGGFFGLVGLVLLVGFVLSSGSDEAESVTTAVPTSVVTETVAPSTVPPTAVPPAAATGADEPDTGNVTLDDTTTSLHFYGTVTTPQAVAWGVNNDDTWTLTVATTCPALVHIDWFDDFPTNDVYELWVDGTPEGMNAAGSTGEADVWLLRGSHTIVVDWLFYETDQPPITGGSWYDITFELTGQDC
jgi:hypothetical protein